MSRMSMLVASLTLTSIACAHIDAIGSVSAGVAIPLANRASEDGKAGTNKAGTNKAGTNKAGTNKAGTNKAGTNKAAMASSGTKAETIHRLGSRAAWIHGLPADASPDGMSCEVVSLTPPDPGTRRMSVTFAGEARLGGELTRLARDKARLAKLSLVVRHDRESGKSDVYHLREVIVQSHASKDGDHVVVLSFGGVETVSALTGNPGPPTGAPEVVRTRSNRGWIHGLADQGESSPLEIEVLDVVPPRGDGRLVLRVAAPAISSSWGTPASQATSIPSVILVLPDRQRAHYVEYKLWDASMHALELSRTPSGVAEWEILFRAPMIECMTGRPNLR